jgi:hypothetical protein
MKMEPITTLNRKKWATSTRCSDQEKMGPITTLNGKKWVTSTLCRDQQQNGAHHNSEREKMDHIDTVQKPGTKWGISPMSREEQQNHETLRNIRLSWESNQRYPAGVQEEGMSE